MPFYGDQSRSDLRAVYLEAWRKHTLRLPLQPVESQVVTVIHEHPEYIAILSDPEAAITQDFPPEHGTTNPFLHMSMHLAVRDQVTTNRPTGIREAFETLVRRRSKHDAEHLIAEHLAELIWQAQRSGQPPDEQVYLRRIQKMTR